MYDSLICKKFFEIGWSKNEVLRWRNPSNQSHRLSALGFMKFESPRNQDVQTITSSSVNF